MAAARRAGRHAQTYFDQGVAVEWKTDASPVTLADREAEQILRDDLLKLFPDDGFLGEEFGEKPGSTGFRWIVDPIDGTRSFVRNIPLWATLVGLEFRDEQIAGIAYMPVMGDTMFRALRGDGAYRDSRRIRVSDVQSLPESVLFYSSLNWFVKAGKERQFLNLVRATQRQRGFGDFYGFLLVAQGSGEVMAEHGVHSWDVAGLKAIVEEAGGRFTNWSGVPTIHSPDVIASNGRLHAEAMAILQGEIKGRQVFGSVNGRTVGGSNGDPGAAGGGTTGLIPEDAGGGGTGGIGAAGIADSGGRGSARNGSPGRSRPLD